MVAKKVNLNVRLNTLFQRLGLTTQNQIKDYLLGRYIIPVVNNASGQTQYPLNKPILIDKFTVVNGASSVYGMQIGDKTYGYAGSQHVYFSECIMAPDNKETLEMELKRIEERKKELMLLEGGIIEKLNYLNDTRSETVDNEGFKKYVISNVLGQKLNKEEKASKILELLSE